MGTDVYKRQNLLYHLALRIALYFAIGVLLPLSLCGGLFLSATTPLGWTIYLLPLYVLLLAWYNASAQWLLRQQQYKRLAQMQLIKGVGNNLLKVLFGLLSATVGSLIAAQLLSIFAPYSLFAQALRKGLRKPKMCIRDRDERTTWDYYNLIREIECTNRQLKTDLHLRPLFHQTDQRSDAHLFFGLLAYWVVNTIRCGLKAQGENCYWREIVRRMSTQKLVTTEGVNPLGEKVECDNVASPQNKPPRSTKS